MKRYSCEKFSLYLSYTFPLLQAEEVMKRVEKEESALVDKKSFHLSIINLVIGTLYCSKVSFQNARTSSNETNFGVSD